MNRDKFKMLVHYVCASRGHAPDTLGAVKLNKILWLSEREFFYLYGKPITHTRYIKREFGPVPAPILPVLRELEEDGFITVHDAKHFGKRKKEYIVHVPISDSFLTKEELEIVKDVINFVCDEHTAKSISDASHDHVWKVAQDGELIPHFTVFATPGKITEAHRRWAQEKLGYAAA